MRIPRRRALASRRRYAAVTVRRAVVARRPLHEYAIVSTRDTLEETPIPREPCRTLFPRLSLALPGGPGLPVGGVRLRSAAAHDHGAHRRQRRRRPGHRHRPALRPADARRGGHRRARARRAGTSSPASSPTGSAPGFAPTSSSASPPSPSRSWTPSTPPLSSPGRPTT